MAAEGLVQVRVVQREAGVQDAILKCYVLTSEASNDAVVVSKAPIMLRLARVSVHEHDYVSYSQTRCIGIVKNEAHFATWTSTPGPRKPILIC